MHLQNNPQALMFTNYISIRLYVFISCLFGKYSTLQLQVV